MCGNNNLIKLLEDAKSAQLSELHYHSQEVKGITKTLIPSYANMSFYILQLTDS